MASSSGEPILVQTLPHERHPEAALVLAAAFLHNPLHVAAFGHRVRERNESFFHERLADAPGTWRMALAGEEIVGVIHWVKELHLDPPRVTLGPLGVRSDRQRQGVGSLLMREYCAEVDADGLAGYLETDQLSNLPFYRRFEFAETGEFTLSGVVQYVMWRPALL